MDFISKYTREQIEQKLDDMDGVDSLLDEINGDTIETINEINGEVI